MPKDTTVRVPPSPSTSPIKQEVYRYRGEAISIGGTVDYIVRRLADAFVGPSTDHRTAALWSSLKGRIAERELTSALQAEMQAMALYFKTRQLAAHGAIVISQVAETTQIFRVYFHGPNHKTEMKTLDELRHEVSTLRAGHEAIQSVGRVLDDDQRDVMRDWNVMARAIVLGRV